MTDAKLKSFISYWSAANMVAFDKIKTVEDAEQAIKWCSCLRVGVAWDLTPEQLFRVISEE